MNLIASSNRFLNLGLDLLFPRRCVGCGTEGSLLCPRCKESLPCIYYLETGVPHIDGIRSLFAYDGVMRQAILQLKYHDVKALAKPLAQLLKEHIESDPSTYDTIVPVPIHPRRLRERGYNQSALIAHELSRLISAPLANGLLLRRRNTPPQARSLSLKERQRNVVGAFYCRGHSLLKGKQILLIDDVCTSGATLGACASALKSAGAASVRGLTLAKEV